MYSQLVGWLTAPPLPSPLLSVGPGSNQFLTPARAELRVQSSLLPPEEFSSPKLMSMDLEIRVESSSIAACRDSVRGPHQHCFHIVPVSDIFGQSQVSGVSAGFAVDVAMARTSRTSTDNGTH